MWPMWPWGPTRRKCPEVNTQQPISVARRAYNKPVGHLLAELCSPSLLGRGETNKNARMQFSQIITRKNDCLSRFQPRPLSAHAPYKASDYVSRKNHALGNVWHFPLPLFARMAKVLALWRLRLLSTLHGFWTTLLWTTGPEIITSHGLHENG